MSSAWLKRIDLETFESERLELPSDANEVSVGRTKQNAIAISSVHVSREHCVLMRTPAGWVVEDRNSSSGTWLNGHRTTRARLTHGDVIDLYGTLLVFLERVEHRAAEAEAALDRAPHDRGATLVWADQLSEHGDPLGEQLMTGVVDPACLEGLAPLCDAGRVELDWRGGLVERARVRCTSDATFQDVDLLGRLMSLRVCRWVRELTVDLCTWTMPASSRLQSDAAAALRGLLSGAELPALEVLSLGYLSTPLPPSHFREALLDRLRSPGFRCSKRRRSTCCRWSAMHGSRWSIARQRWSSSTSGPRTVVEFHCTPASGSVVRHRRGCGRSRRGFDVKEFARAS